MKMMNTGKPDLSAGFTLKRDRDRSMNQESDEDATTSFEDINNLLSMPIPSLSKKFLVPNDPNDEFLRLTTMVRAVYVSYLHKCLLSNYIFCYKERNKEIPCMQLKKCADELELNAVRYSLEASLYRQHMLKLISDIKSHTSEKKAYKKLLIHLESPSDKIDAAVQTDNSWAELERLDNIQSVCITSNCEELSLAKQGSQWSDDEDTVQIDHFNAVSPHSTGNNTASPTVNSTSFFETDHSKLNESDEEINVPPPEETVKNTQVQEVTIKQNSNTCPVVQDNPNVSLANDTIRNDDENSQDSILQHMEDMFCESDDSSDLTTLIERHSGISKANIDKEINKMCQEAESFLSQNSNNDNRNSCNNNVKPDATKANNFIKPPSTAPNKFSFSYYKEMKSRGMTNPLPPEPESIEIKQKRRANSVWFVERVHQVSKLKAKMTELSLKNYRKYGRVKEKFIELFGESDDEEMMPDSPICIEDHLTACKERIAPWIVKHLMPLYKKRRIKDRQLFKAVAKHIADMLILENTFPEQDCVSKYIEKYFRNKKIIKTKQDIYL